MNLEAPIALESMLNFKIQNKKPVRVVYKNWKGETSVRKIIPESLYYGSSEWHPENQWLLRAFDLDKEAYRDFALSCMEHCESDNALDS